MQSEELKFKRKIRESFFNPMFHFMPILCLIVLDDFFSTPVAYQISIFLAIGIGFYIKISHGRIFDWHKNFTGLFLFLCFLFNLSSKLIIVEGHLLDELILVFIFGLVLLFRRFIEVNTTRNLPKDLPMTNNFQEMYNVIFALLSVLIVYIICHFYFSLSGTDIKTHLLYLNFGYIGCILTIWIYETIRVVVIRHQLAEEEWWPVVNTQGRVIGSIQHVTSLNDKQKFLHPIVRVLLIDNGRILLEKNQQTNIWDTSVASHLRYTETIEQGVKRVFLDRHNWDVPKYFHLSTHQVETINEKQYVFLFVTCQINGSTKLDDLQHNMHLKWWTKKQIDDNINSGIFNDTFKLDYSLLLRSGLLDSEKCQCACKLRQTIFDFKRDNQRMSG